MPVRKMTAEEAEQIFGNGFIVIGRKRPVPGKQGDAPPVALTKSGVSVHYTTKDDYKKLNFYNVGPVYRADGGGASESSDTHDSVLGEEPLPPEEGV